MNFVLNMAWREIRASWHRLLFFFICIAIGVGSIVSLRSLLQSVNASVGREARSLLTADVQVSSSNPWSEEAKAVLERYARSPLVTAQTEVLEMPTMLRPAADAQARPKMIELKAVQAPFPLYGDMELSGGQRYDFALLKERGALVRASLLTQLNLRVGDEVKIGDLIFTIRGVIEKEPGNTISGFNLGPRVLVDYADALAAGLTGFGSRARYRTLYKTRAGEEENLRRQLRRDIGSQPGVNVRSFRYSQDRMSASLTQVENYLSLIGLVILVLGGIGISSVTRVFIQQKMKTIAILKCLGGDNRRVLGAYLAQVLALGFAGSLLGLLLARVTTYIVPKYFADRIPFQVEFGLTWQATLQGLGIGLLISLLFSLLPLLEIRQIKPVLVLRHETAAATRRVDWVRLSAGLIVLLGLIALASWQAGSLIIGGLFLGGLAVTAFVLNLAGAVLMRSLRQARHIPSFVLRQGVNSLYRPGNQTKVILLAVGLGTFFVISVRLLQANLMSEFNLDLSSATADMYLIDIQKDQRAGVAATVARYTGSAPKLIPTVRARIVKLKDEQINFDGAPSRENRGLLRREYTLTYRPNLEENETIIAGQFWDATPSAEPEISIEEVIAEDLKVGVGDTMTFDIQGSLGQQTTAKITSLRRVDWRNSRTGFLVLFRPGALEDAPQTLISAVKGPPPGEQRAQLQRALVDQFPNVSVIDVFDIIELARNLINNVSLAVTFVGGFVFLSGVLILVGSIAMTKFHRLYEAAILKTLGAKKKLIIYTVLVEYGALGLLAGLIGSAAAIALTWAISKYGLELTWQFMPSINLLGVAATLLLVTIVGVLSSWDVMIKKPLGILRSE
jgi:putative ABC transport system permease protein